jgi:hypothetical protein
MKRGVYERQIRGDSPRSFCPQIRRLMVAPQYLLQFNGDIWIAAAPGHIDPSENAVGRGTTQEEAIDDLTRQPEFQAWLRENQLPNPTVADFEIRQGRLDLTFTDAQGKRHGTNPATR